MRTAILSFIFLLSCSLNAQNSSLKEIKKVELNKFIGSIYEYKKVPLKNNSLTLFITTNDSGSLKNKESDEVTQNLYISNCHDGETTDCRLYLVKNYVNIKIDDIIEDSKNIYIKITHGMANDRHSEKLTISL